MSPQGQSEPSAEEIYNFFSEQMWRPSLVLWVGWPAVLACFAGAIIVILTFDVYSVGAVLFLIAVGIAGYLVYCTLEGRRRWVDYIEASKAQLERDFRRPDSMVCLIQRVGLGLRDRLLLVRRNELHFKGYFMSPAKAKRLAGASGIGYVESAKVLSGVLPLKSIKSFRACYAIRLRYVILVLIGAGLGLACLPRAWTGAGDGRTALLGVIVFFAIGILGLVLTLFHREPQVAIHTGEYDLHVVAHRPDPDTVLRFLRRIGYREIGAPAQPVATKKSEKKE